MRRRTVKREVLVTHFPLRRNFLFLASVSLVVFLSRFDSAKAEDPRDNSSTQAVAHANTSSLLKQESLVAHVESGKYSQVRMRPEAKVSSQDFFTRYARDFDLSKDDVFKPVFSRANPLLRAKSQIVIRYQQHYKNLPVIGMEYVLQMDAANHVLAASGKIISGLKVDINPSVSESRALEMAKHAVPAQVYSWEKNAAKLPKGTLAISFKDFKIDLKNARLVYRFIISSDKPSQSYVLEVDAHTGEVINKINNRISDVIDWNQNIPNCVLAGYGTRTVTVLCDKGADGKYRLMCVPGTFGSCPAPMKMIDARRPNPQAQGGADPNQDYVFTDEDHQNPPVFGEKNVPGESDDIVGGYLYLAMLYSMKFYSQYFGWAGYDGLGQAPLFNYVKPIEDTPNSLPAAALYGTPTPHSITFDPNRTVMIDANGHVDMFYALVAGHEFTHGVLTELIHEWVPEGETAALDESFADIMGILAIYYNACYGGSTDFKTCVEGIGHPEAMSDPKESDLPTTYKGFYFAESEGCNGSATCYHTPETTVPCVSSNYDCDAEHRNATVQSYMFYLLASGGAGINDPPLNHPYNVEGIGPYEAGQIAFQTMFARLLPTSTYPEARDAWIAAAEDLYGKKSKEVRAVTLAWYAVGIGDISGMDVSHNPPDGTENVPPWPATLEWEDQSDEVQWEVQTSTSPDFDRDLLTKQASVPIGPPHGSALSSVNFNLKPATNYYWRVRAKRNPSSSGTSASGSRITTGPSQGGPGLQTGWGDWSLLRYFKTDERASTLKSPVGKATKVYPWGDEFKWTGVEGGKQYWLETSESSDLGIGSNLGPGQVSPIQNVQPNNPLQSVSLSGVYVDPNDPDNREGANRIKHSLPSALKVNHTYYWGVLPYGPENIQGNWSNHQKGQVFQTSTPQTKLTSPDNAAKVSPWGINLQWEETPGSVGYVLKVSEHPDFPDNIYNGPDPTGTSQVLNLSLETGAEPGVSQGPQPGGAGGPVVQGTRRDYYWSVTPKGPPPWNEKGLASQVWGFNIDRQATKPTLIYPRDGALVPYKQPSLRFLWKPVDQATGYFFSLYHRNADGSRGAAILSNWSIPVQEDDRGYAYVDDAYLRHEVVTEKPGYCWQVQAIGPDDLHGNFNPGPASDIFCYSLAPDKPVLTSPVDGSPDVEYNPTPFAWTSEWAPGGYQISVGLEGSSTGWVNVSGKSYTLNLKPNTSYFWVVDALGSAGERTSSGFSHFSTKAAPCNAPDAPQILDPAGGWSAPPISNPYQYRWSSVPGAVQYEFTVNWVNYDNPTDRRVLFHSYYTGTVSDPVSLQCGCGKGCLYLWTIRAKSSCGAWSAAAESGWYGCQ
jgi:Zn-dependent metalloprotease